MADIKVKYPQTNADTVAITHALASLADDNTNKLAGAQTDIIDNTTNLDLDHILTGVIKLGTSPTAGRTIEIWAFAPRKIASGSATYPDVLTGAGAATKTLTSANVKAGMLIPVMTLTTDGTTGRNMELRPISIASLFGGNLPPKYGLFVLNCTGVALDSTSSNHELSYYRVQGQTV